MKIGMGTPLDVRRDGRECLKDKERRLVRQIPCVNVSILAIGYHIPAGKTISGGELAAYIVKSSLLGIREMGKNLLETGCSEEYVSKQNCADFGIGDRCKFHLSSSVPWILFLYDAIPPLPVMFVYRKGGSLLCVYCVYWIFASFAPG